jgi:hypothetical protein
MDAWRYARRSVKPRELNLKSAFEAARARAEARIASEEAGAGGDEPVPLSDEDWSRFVALFTPNQGRVLDIASEGSIAVVVLEPRGLTRTMLERMGWDGKAPVFPINRTRAEKIARLTEAPPQADDMSARWLRHRERGITRVFAVIGFGAYILTWGPDGELVDSTKL